MLTNLQGTMCRWCTFLAWLTGTRQGFTAGDPLYWIYCIASFAKRADAPRRTCLLVVVSTFYRFGCGPVYRLDAPWFLIDGSGSMWRIPDSDLPLHIFRTMSQWTMWEWLGLMWSTATSSTRSHTQWLVTCLSYGCNNYMYNWTYFDWVFNFFR